METQSIKFKQERDFGEIFNASFAFIRQELKPLGKAVLYFVLPVLIVAAILNMLVGFEQQKFLDDIRVSDPSKLSNPFAAMGNTFKYLIPMMLVYAIGLTSLRCTIYGYIKLYITKGKDQFSLNELWLEIKNYFFPILGTSILVGIIVGIGFIFCILPGIFLGVSLSIIYMALTFENKGFSDAFGRSFALTKQQWWVTFGLIVVVFIMIYLVSLLLAIPAMLMGFKSFFTSFKSMQTGGNMHISTSYYVLTSITSLIMYVLFSVPYIVLAFQYFNLVEIKEKPSLQEKIEQIG
jgi:hypothetical protein